MTKKEFDYCFEGKAGPSLSSFILHVHKRSLLQDIFIHSFCLFCFLGSSTCLVKNATGKMVQLAALFPNIPSFPNFMQSYSHA